jgi:hypothetical protein
VKHKLALLKAQLGLPGMAGLALLACVAVFQGVAVGPQETEQAEMEQRLSRNERKAGGGKGAGVDSARLEAFYNHFRGDAGKDEWLAKLHAIAGQSGVELRSADYRLQATGTRIERYEIVLPVSAGYGQLRAFLKGALEQIPVLSLDQVSLRKDKPSDKAGDGRLQAEVRMTLHLLKGGTG